MAPARDRRGGFGPTLPPTGRRPARSRTGTTRGSPPASTGATPRTPHSGRRSTTRTPTSSWSGTTTTTSALPRRPPRGALDRARGIREFVVGSGGKSLRTFPTVRPWSQARDVSSLGILELTLRARGVRLALPPGGRVFHGLGHRLLPLSSRRRDRDFTELLPQTQLRLLSYRSENESRERGAPT